MRKLIPALILALALAGALILAINHFASPSRVRVPPTRGGDFTLQGSGGPWALSKDGHGFVTLLYFGFTHCPGICPMAMEKTRAELGKLSPQKRGLIKVVFVSVDYRQDTAASTEKFAKSFGPEFVGLSGSKSELDAVTAKYGAAYAVRESAPGSGKFFVDHSNQIFVINPQGELVRWLASGYEDASLVKTIQELLESESPRT